MIGGVFHQPWTATVVIIGFAVVAGVWAWQATKPLDDDGLIDSADAPGSSWSLSADR